MHRLTALLLIALSGCGSAPQPVTAADGGGTEASPDPTSDAAHGQPVESHQDGSVKASDAAAPDSPSTLRLCSWNTKKMGHGTTKDFGTLAAILESECDASVILEVMQKGGTHPGYEDLLSTLGSGWTGVVTTTPRPNTTGAQSEFYAVVWRSGALEQCQGWNGLRYVADNDGSTSGTGPDNFSREPAFGCFKLSGAAGQVDFLLAAYHAVWGTGSATDIQQEVRHIDSAVTEMKATRPGENDIFVLGDFNLVPTKLDEVTTMRDWTLGVGSTLNSAGDVTANLYDHVLAANPEATPELGAKAEVLDVRDRVASGQVFYSTVSDHLPIRVVLRVVGPDND